MQGGPAGDRRHDADCVSVHGSRIFLFQKANVLVVQIRIHRAASSSVIGKEMLAQLSKGGSQMAERLARRDGTTFDAGLSAGKLAQRRRNQYFYGHARIPPLNRQWIGCCSPGG